MTPKPRDAAETWTPKVTLREAAAARLADRPELDDLGAQLRRAVAANA